MRTLYLASVFAHVLAAAAWIGGMLALAFVVMPVLRGEGDRRHGLALLGRMALRLRSIGWIALATLAVTGVFQAGYRTGGVAALVDAAYWSRVEGALVASKLCVFALIAGLQAFHDFAVGPRAIAAGERAPEAPETLRLRRRAGWIGRLNVALSVLALGLGIVLVRGLP